MAAFTMVGTTKKQKKKNKKKNMQFGIFVFVEAQETNLQDNFQGCKCDGDCIVL